MKLRGSTCIWTPNTVTNTTWPLGGYLKLSDNTVTIQSFHEKVGLTHDNIVELRFYRRLIPHVTAVTRTGDVYALCTYWGLRGSRLKQLFIDRGFVFDSITEWTPLNQVAKDCRQYGLYFGTAP